MANGIKKLQKVQFGMESVAGTAVSPTTLWRGIAGVLDDQRTLNKVEENVGILADTLRTNISKVLGMISLPSSNATFEQIQHLFAMGIGGPTIGAFDGGSGTGAILTPVLTGAAVTSATITAAGSGYTVAPTLLFYGGSPTTPATATCTVSAGAITAVNITGGGTGYTSAPKLLVIPNGAGSDGIYQTALPVGTIPTATPYTITGGDNFETEQMEYALCIKVDITGDAGGELKVASDIQGRQVQFLNNTANPTLFTPSVVEDILFQLGKVYLDNIGGSFGTTQVSNAIKGIKLTFEFKWKPEFTSDGVLYYTIATFTGWTVKGELKYLHNTPVSGSGGAKSFFRNQTAKLLRVDFGGSALATPGTTYSNKHLIFDLPIKFENVGTLDNDDGTSTVTMPFFGGYEFTAGNAGKVIVVSDVRVLPVYQ